MPSVKTRRRGRGGASITAPGSIPAQSGSRLVERVVIGLTQERLADRRQQVIVVVVADVERQVAVDPLERRRSIQRARAAGADAVLDHAFGQMLDDVARPAAG